MILLTGATGFVGRSVLAKLLARGQRVRCLMRGAAPVSAPAGQGSGNCEWVRGDVDDPSSLIKAMDGVEKVIHLVGIIVPVGDNTFERIHAQGTHHVVEAAKKAAVKKIVHMSALGTHAGAASQYHQTKWKGEVTIRYSGLPYAIFRPSIVFGPADQFLNMFARMMRWSPVIPLVGGGVNRLQPIWVQDVAEFFVRALDNAQSDGKVYELGGPQAYTMRELMELLMEIVRVKRWLVPVPIALMRLQAMVMERVLTKPPLTRDQLIMMQSDNTCDSTEAVRDFGVTPAPLAETLQTYMR